MREHDNNYFHDIKNRGIFSAKSRAIKNARMHTRYGSTYVLLHTNIDQLAHT